MSGPRDQLCINTLRFLSVDRVQGANSGHPGLPLGAAPMAATTEGSAIGGRAGYVPGYVGAYGDMIGLERFGASAPAATLLREYGFTVDNVVARARTLLAR